MTRTITHRTENEVIKRLAVDAASRTLLGSKASLLPMDATEARYHLGLELTPGQRRVFELAYDARIAELQERA